MMTPTKFSVSFSVFVYIDVNVFCCPGSYALNVVKIVLHPVKEKDMVHRNQGNMNQSGPRLSSCSFFTQIPIFLQFRVQA